ncbi:MAG: glycogen debranching enzyme N-terminal domain-containing protein [Clostridium sp.]
MKIYKLNLSLKEITDKEYILTNGLGGYASQTISSMNTRRYHGLLVKAQNSPGLREVLVSKVDESIIINDEEYPLYTNISNNYISNGFNHMQVVEYTIYPKITYEICGVKITKEIIMKHESNIVGLKYTIKNSNQPVKLNLTPLLTRRNFHYLNSNNLDEIEKEKLQKIFKTEKIYNDKTNGIMGLKYIYSDSTKEKENALTILVNDAKYIPYTSNYFENMYYVREDERGFDSTENLLIKGTFEIEIPKNVIKEVFVNISADNIIQDDMSDAEIYNVFKENNFDNILKLEKNRLKNLYDTADLEYEYEKDIILNDKTEYKKLETFKEMIIQSADQFIVKRDQYTSIIAGYHWFLDWGRDSLISFEGLLLKTNRYEDAKKLLKFYTHDISEGLVPNAYDENTSLPYYNSADASLLLFEAVQKYLEYTRRL